MKPKTTTAAPSFHRETAVYAPSRNRTENLLIKSQNRRETRADSRPTTEDSGDDSDPDPDTYRRTVAQPSHDCSHDSFGARVCLHCAIVLVVTTDALDRSRARCPRCEGINRITPRLAAEHRARSQGHALPLYIPVRFVRNRAILLSLAGVGEVS